MLGDTGESTIDVMSRNVIRTFVAIELPSRARAVLGSIVAELAPHVPDNAVRWVDPDSMHLTLSFLGDTPLDRIPAVAAALDAVGRQSAPFALELDRLGCFPNPGRPRVVWVGVHGDLTEARELKRAVDEALEPLGWKPERREYHPHLTLGRVKRDHRLIDLPWGKPVVPQSIVVESIHLIESQLTPRGAIYTTRHSAPLGS